ncbi:hypothetical protein AMECASPLE_024089 [Ameca splendens]|uniref:Uncharacterized protein n=1 Tax=Ameca splendens TaxID=208324 RepID=A0ABV0Z293_9TELE
MVFFFFFQKQTLTLSEPTELQQQTAGLFAKKRCSDLNKENVPKCLIPVEMFCKNCPGPVPLGDPLLISKMANAVLVIGTIKVSDLDGPAESYNGEVNIEEFCNTVAMEMIAFGSLNPLWYNVAIW